MDKKRWTKSEEFKNQVENLLNEKNTNTRFTDAEVDIFKKNSDDNKKNESVECTKSPSESLHFNKLQEISSNSKNPIIDIFQNDALECKKSEEIKNVDNDHGSTEYSHLITESILFNNFETNDSHELNDTIIMNDSKGSCMCSQSPSKSLSVDKFVNTAFYYEEDKFINNVEISHESDKFTKNLTEITTSDKIQEPLESVNQEFLNNNDEYNELLKNISVANEILLQSNVENSVSEKKNNSNGLYKCLESPLKSLFINECENKDLYFQEDENINIVDINHKSDKCNENPTEITTSEKLQEFSTAANQKSLYNNDDYNDLDELENIPTSDANIFESNVSHSVINDLQLINSHKEKLDTIFVGCKQFGLKKIFGDGNCLFRCFAYHIYGDEQERHADIRRQIVNFTVLNWEHQFSILDATSCDFKYKSKSHYAEEMMKDGTYGTDYEIGVFSNIFCTTVLVYEKEVLINTKEEIVRQTGTITPVTQSKSMLRLLFSGANKQQGHFEILIDEMDTISTCSKINEDDDKVDLEMNNIENRNDNMKSFMISSMISPTSFTEKSPTLKTSTPNRQSPSSLNLPMKSSIMFSSLLSQQVTATPRIITRSVSSNLKFPRQKVLSFEKSPKRICKESKNTIDLDYSDETYKSDSSESKKSDIETPSSESESNDDDNDNKEEKTKKEKVGKYDIFKYTVSTVEIASTAIYDEYGDVDVYKLKVVIEEIMWDSLNVHCHLRFYGMRQNLQDNVIYAFCKDVEHDIKYKFCISNDANKPMSILNISSTLENFNSFLHKTIESFKQVRGLQRNNLKKLLKKERAIIVQQNLVNETDVEKAMDGNMQNLVKLSVLHKIVSEDRCGKHLFLESRDIQDLIQLWANEQKLQDPFLRNVDFPISVAMYTMEDLEIVSQKKKKGIILHVDATGSIGRAPKGLQSKRLFYYSAAVRLDFEILELFRFLTTEHGIVSIGTVLFRYKFFVMKNYEWPFFSAVVVDWSWAFIHSFLLQWNDMSIDRYLELEFNYCENLDSSFLKDVILIKICYAHFMHIVSRTLDKKFCKIKIHKTIILEIFSLLCLSRDFADFDVIFSNLCIILLTKNKSKFETTMKVIAQLSQKHSTDIEQIAKETSEFFENCNKIDTDDDCIKNSMYSKSPFYEKYNKIISVLEVEMEQNELDNEVSNTIYCPEFVNHILTVWIPYLPLWTALDLDLINPKISRLSNAYIEATHKVNKDYVVQNTRNTSIGDVVRLLEHRRKDILARIYLNVDLKGKKRNKKPLYPETTSNPNIKEGWKKTHMKSKGHDKSYNLKELHENYEALDEVTEKEIHFEESNNEDAKYEKLKDEILNKMNSRKRKRKQGKKNNKKVKLSENYNSKNDSFSKNTFEKNKDNDKANDQESDIDLNNFQTSFDDIIDNEEKKHDESESKSFKTSEKDYSDKSVSKASLIDDKNISTCSKGTNIDEEQNTTYKYPNGLICDIKYYSRCASPYVIISRYNSKKCLTRESFDLSAKELITAFGNRWFNGLVIDAYVISCINNWENVCYIPTDDTISIIGNFAAQGLKNSKLLSLEKPLENIIIMVYLYNYHWRMLKIDSKNALLTVFDPYGDSSDEKRVVKAFKQFVKNCDEKSSFGKLKNASWKVTKSNKHPIQKNNDGCSCGPLVTYFVDCVGSGNNFETKLDVAKFREKIVSVLLEKSQNMTNSCLHCVKDITIEYYSCITCERKIHKECVYYSLINVDEGTNVEKLIQMKGKIVIPESFQCKLCKTEVVND